MNLGKELIDYSKYIDEGDCKDMGIVTELLMDEITTEGLKKRLDELIAAINKSNFLKERELYLKEEELKLKKKEMGI